MEIEYNQYYQELLYLTPKQQKLWDDVVKSLEAFRKAKGKVHTVLDTLFPYNGLNYTGSEMLEHIDKPSAFLYDLVGINTRYFFNPNAYTWDCLGGYADDPHAFIIKESKIRKTE